MTDLLPSVVWLVDHPFQVLGIGVLVWCLSSLIAGALWQERRSNYTTYSRGVRMGYAKGWEACAKALWVA